MAHHKALQRVAAIRLAINHVHNIVDLLARLNVPARPVVAGAPPLSVDEKVLGVVKTTVVARADPVDDTVLEVEEDRTGDVMLVIGLR